MLPISSPDNVAVGAVFPYAGDLSNSEPPTGWLYCNGQSVATNDYPELYGAIGNACGGQDGSFYIPDYRGMFLRGLDDSDSGRDPDVSTRTAANPKGNTGALPGTLQDWATAAPTTALQMGVPNVPDDWHHTDVGAIGPLAHNMADRNDDGDTFSITGGDNETRPPNIYVYYIIKAQSGTTSGVTQVPVGAGMSYAGSAKVSKDDWVLCDGNSDPTNDDSDLYSVIGMAFGGVKGVETFYIPDFRGVFLRGVNEAGSKDPDFQSRGASRPDITRGPGNSGNSVGSRQEYATKAAQHKQFTVVVPKLPDPDNYHDIYPTSGHNNINRLWTGTSQTWSGGDKESRPINAYVDWYARVSIGSDASDGFPVGGVIAFPGNNILPSRTFWVECNGASVATAGTYSRLYTAIAHTHGGSGEYFNLPDYRGRFLRGSDPEGLKDPDSSSRTAANTGGNSGARIGSIQAFATGLPKTSFTPNPAVPTSTDHHDNAATAVGNMTADWNEGTQYFDFGGGDDETRPCNAAVVYYIKFQHA